MACACFKCNVQFGDGDRFAECDGCRLRFHYDCTDLTGSEIRVMELKNKRSLKYFCDACQEGLRLIPVLQKRLTSLEQHITTFEKNVNTKLEEFLAKVNSDPGTRTEPADSGVSNDLLQEVFQRQKRMNNIMIFNLDLRTDGPHELQVSSLLTEVAGRQIDVSNVVMIGKPNCNGHKSIKACLTNANDVSLILRNRNKFVEARKAYVEADLSPAQRGHLHDVKEELSRRRANGEVDLTIKYSNGTPSIVSKAAKK